MNTIFIITVLLAVLAGAPLFCIAGAASLYCFYFIAHVDISSTIIEICRLANAPGITAIPMFIFTGYILSTSRAASRLVNVSMAIFGRLPGGGPIVTVVACAIFTAITGASGITIVAVGGLLLPALLKEGYDDNFSVGLVTGVGSIGLLFIPSLPIIIYGMVAQVDITKLFIAGTLPGLLLVSSVVAYGVIYAKKKSIPTIPFSAKNLLNAVWDAKWELPLSVVIVGGIYSGYFTPSEAAAVSAVYVLISECLIYREIPFKKLKEAILSSMIMMGAILIILGTALGLANFMIDRHIPQQIMVFVQGHIHDKYIFLLALNGILLFLGCVLDIFSAIIIVVPLLIPTASAFGIDPIHLGIIFLANMEIGYLTPPIGINLFIASMRFDRPLLSLYRMIFPFLLIMLVDVLIITYWPSLSLILLDVFFQGPPLINFKSF